MDTKNKVTKFNKKKNLLFLFIIIFIVGNISFYFKERAKWMYDGQPYPKAKEWLIPANMMLVYGTTLTKLPFVDERSWIMKPIIALQDYFVKKWQENLPDDDAEKYLGWYIFKLRTYIIPNAGGIILYGSRKYTFDDVKNFNDKSWSTIEAMVKYSTKDKEFNEIRYAAFNNLSALFVANFSAYWIHNSHEKNSSDSYLTKNSYLDIAAMNKDHKHHEQLFLLYKWINQMDEEYKLIYSKIYKRARRAKAAEYWINSRMQELTQEILSYLIETKKYKKIKNFCNVNSNTYLKDYILSKEWLLSKEEFLKTKGISIKKTISFYVDNELQNVCININKKGVKQWRQ